MRLHVHAQALRLPYTLLILVVGLCLWICILVACTVTPPSTRPEKLDKVTPNQATTSSVLQLFLPLQSPEFQDRTAYQQPDAGDTVKHLWRVLTSAAEVAAQGNGSHSILPQLLEVTANLAISSAATHLQLCDWLKEDIMPSARPQKVFVAGLLTNTEALMPHYVLQLLKFSVSLPSGSIFVSMYESGSTDSTGDRSCYAQCLSCKALDGVMIDHCCQLIALCACVCAIGPWLRLLAKLLRLLEVPHHIETGIMVSAMHHNTLCK